MGKFVKPALIKLVLCYSEEFDDETTKQTQVLI